MKRSLTIKILVICFTFVLYSCSDTPVNPPPSGTNVIKIGALFSLSTGDWSTLGKTSKAALDIEVVRMNSYLSSINSNNVISVSYYDTFLNPDSALNQTKRMYQDGVRIIVGPQSSSEVSKIKSFIDSVGMISVSQGSTAGSLSIPNDNIYRFCPVDSMEAIASVAMMMYDTVDYLVPVYRTDVGNTGLFNSVSHYYSIMNPGGTMSSAISYTPETMDFTSIVQQIKSQIQSAPPGQKFGVYLASFDENVQIFNAANNEPILKSVIWYGSDGVVQSAILTGNSIASQFAEDVKYFCPIFGLDVSSLPIRQQLENQIISATGIQPDAFTFAAYDAFRVASLTADLVPSLEMNALKSAFVGIANSYFGASGWTALNSSGDRAYANFDFWAVKLIGGTHQWKIVARYNSNTGMVEIL